MGNEHQLSFPSANMAKAMKAMKAMAKKAVSKIAKGKMARSVVFRGTKEKTATGMTKGDLIKNSRGKIVSKKQSALAKKRYATGIKGWVVAVQKARKALGEGLRCNQEGLSSLQKGQGTLPVSVHHHAEASAQGVGMSTPFERRRFGEYDATVSTIDER